MPKINLDYLFFYSHCVLERATTAFITESHSYFLWKQAVICLQQTLNTTVSHMLRQKPEAPFPHWKKPLPLILALGFCSLCELGADSSKLLSGALVSLGAEVLSAPHPRASSSPSIGSHEVDARCWRPGDLIEHMPHLLICWVQLPNDLQVFSCFHSEHLHHSTHRQPMRGTLSLILEQKE